MVVDGNDDSAIFFSYRLVGSTTPAAVAELTSIFTSYILSIELVQQTLTDLHVVTILQGTLTVPLLVFVRLALCSRASKAL